MILLRWVYLLDLVQTRPMCERNERRLRGPFVSSRTLWLWSCIDIMMLPMTVFLRASTHPRGACWLGSPAQSGSCNGWNMILEAPRCIEMSRYVPSLSGQQAGFQS
ncbi:hypothetical protein QBC43DRAFT_307521 [Cladorrhinum sp. PSN259]|nr:hypothetical protein QBC43DRAFT_307521 [Cladorrhinum sp. PSN259]